MLYKPETAIQLDTRARLLDGVQRALARLREAKAFLLFVLAPTVVAAAYLFLFAANQYVSEAKFIVRGAQNQPLSALGQVLGAAGFEQAQEETSGVDAYMVSHDAVSALQRELDLVSIFRRSGWDFLSRMSARPKAEDLDKRFRRQVRVVHDTTTGVNTLEVRAFQPEDAQRIANALLLHGEQLVNRFNERAQENTLRVARAEVARSEARLAEIGTNLTRFRTQRQALDPAKSSAMVLQVAGGLEAELAKARATLASQRATLKPGSPTLVALEARVSALQQQVAAQNSRMTGGAGSLAPVVAGYERLALEQEFAAKEYASAMASLEAARVDAQKQHMYLVRVVEPNRPERSLYPNRWITLLTVFVSLLVAYGIGWLIYVGVQEHAA